MPKGIDLSSLSPAERMVLTSGGLLFCSGIVPWWYRAETPDGGYSYNAGLTGWGTAAVLAGAACAIGVLVRAARWPRGAPRIDGIAYTDLGALSVAALLIQSTRAQAIWWGFYVGLLLAALLAVGGIRRLLERRAGWT